MAVIDFLPDRLNNPPVVWKGFTSGEFLLAAVVGVIVGIPLAIPLSLLPFLGWLAFPSCMLIMPLLVVFIGGGWFRSYKRGKPENYVWKRLEEIRCRMRFSSSMVLSSRVWEIQRTRAMTRGGRV